VTAESHASAALPLGATIGILGGGQLGRMSAHAAARLGYRTHVFTPEADSPAGEVASAVTVATFEDFDALAGFVAAVDVVTFEFENIAPEVLDELDRLGALCRPATAALRITQDRILEKRFLGTMGIPIAPWGEVPEGAGGVDIPYPAVLKTSRLGYDGRGQARVENQGEAAAARRRLAPHPLVWEAFMPFTMEISAVAARGVDGTVAIYDIVENLHRHHILAESRVPARIDDATGHAARAHVGRVLDGLEFVGVLALEMFVMPDGAVIANEIAPRPHNSGHWTMDACQVSQFDQHIRAVAGLPVLAPRRHADVVMDNLVGPEGAARWAAAVADADCVPHWYGKREVRAGRKLGHVNRLAPLDAPLGTPGADQPD